MRSDVTLRRAQSKKTRHCWKSPSLLMEDSASKYGSVLMQHQTHTTTTAPNFKSFFTRSGGLAPGPSIWWNHRPKTLGRALLPGRLAPSCSGVQAIDGTKQETPATGEPSYHFAQLAFRELPPVSFTSFQANLWLPGAAGSLRRSLTPEPYSAI